MEWEGFPYGPKRETRDPSRLTGPEADKLVNSVRIAAGSLGDEERDHERAAHQLGVVVTGTYSPVPHSPIDGLTQGRHLVSRDEDRPQWPAVVRLSNFQKHQDWRARDLRGMATRIEAGDGWQHDLVAISSPRFITRRVQDFHHISRRGKRALPLLLATRRTTLTAAARLVWEQRLKPHRSLAATTFHGVHTFWLETDHLVTPFRYRWVPVGSPRKRVDRRLDHDLRAQLPVEYDLWFQWLPDERPAHRLNDAMRKWPKRLGRIAKIGRLTLRELPDSHAAETDWVFNPLHLPPGVLPSDDEILQARGAAYDAGHVRRKSA